MAEPSLQRGITGVGFFALAFGTIIGSGWMVLLGDWISPAGPGGAALAFLAMAILMVPITAAYAELVARVPRAGAEFVFIEKAFGSRRGFVVGWFLALYFVAMTAFEGLALSWFLQNLLPSVDMTHPLYTILGYPVSWLSIAVGLGGTALITFSNASGAAFTVGFQKVVTFGFLIASVALVVLGFVQGHPANWQPLFEGTQGRSFAGGMFVMSATACMWLSGFQTAASAVEERSPKTSFRTVACAMAIAMIAASLFYCLIILSSTSLTPWRGLTSGALPVAAAFDHALPYGLATKGIILIAMVSLLKTWNAMHLGATRVIFAQARAGFLPAALAVVDARRGAPRRAALLVGFATCLGVLAGRGAISLIVGMGTICTNTITLLAVLALIRLRRKERDGRRPAFVLPGGNLALYAVAAGATFVAVASVAAPFIQTPGVPIEIWLIVGWLLAGIFMMHIKKASHKPRGAGSNPLETTHRA